MQSRRLKQKLASQYLLRYVFQAFYSVGKTYAFYSSYDLEGTVRQTKFPIAIFVLQK